LCVAAALAAAWFGARALRADPSPAAPASPAIAPIEPASPAAPAVAPVASDHVYTGCAESPDDVNPLTAASAVARRLVLARTHDGLLAADPATGDLVPAAAERFEYSLAQNHWDHVTLHRVALGRPSSTLEMIEHTTTAALSRNAAFQIALPFRIYLAWMKFRGRIVPTRRRTVPCWSLGELLRHERIEEVDLLKMDCEGSEYEILAHTEDRDLRRFRRIAMEYHLFHPTHRVETLVNRLQKCGFEVQVSRKWFDFWFAKVGMLFAKRRD
jgi:FkbM family methyltransferase